MCSHARTRQYAAYGQIHCLDCGRLWNCDTITENGYQNELAVNNDLVTMLEEEEEIERRISEASAKEGNNNV